MNIEFKAQSVEYADAIDGEIVQVHFIENKNDDVFNPKYCSVGISISYEFPPEHLTAQYDNAKGCLLYTSPSPRDGLLSRMPSSA